MQNDQVFSGTAHLKDMMVVFIHTYHDSRKPYLRQQKIPKGEWLLYRSAFDQAAFAKHDSLKTWLPSIPIYTITAITEHLKFTTFKVKQQQYCYKRQHCQVPMVSNMSLLHCEGWENTPLDQQGKEIKFSKMILQLHYWQASTSSQYGNDPGPREETHLGKPYLFQHCYAQKNNYITPHVLLKCCWPLSFHDFGHNKSFLNLPGPHNNKQPTNLMGIYTYSLNACHISLWTKASMSSK